MMSVDMGNLECLMREKDDKYQSQLQTVVNCRLFIQTFFMDYSQTSLMN